MIASQHPAAVPNDLAIYDPQDPLNAADRLLDPDDGIDYDQLIAESEADRLAGVYLSWEEFDRQIRIQLDEIRAWRRAQGWCA